MLNLRQFGLAAGVLGALGLLAPWLRRPRLTSAAAYCREAGVIIALYVLWQLLLDQLVVHVGGAVERGQWIWDLERTLHLPSEASFQRLVLPHPLASKDHEAACDAHY